MTLEQTPFCTVLGLLDFSKSIKDLYQKLLTTYNFSIRDNAQEDKLEFWGSSESCHAVCYGRHFLYNDQYDLWIGLDIVPEKVTVTIRLDGINNKKNTVCLEELKCKKGKYFDTAKENEVSLNGDCFERFCESLSSQILTNFAAEVLRAVKWQ